MPIYRVLVSALLLAPAFLAGCSFSFSVGGPDYEKLEGAITDELNGSYADIGREVSDVDCPRQENLKVGDSFVCSAAVDDHTVRVEVNVTDGDYNVDMSTLDIVYDLTTTADGLSDDLSSDYGFPVTVSCGEGLEVVGIGESFQCTAFDPQGQSRTVEVTAGEVGEGDTWRVLD